MTGKRCLFWEEGGIGEWVKERDPRMGRARLASLSTRRWNLTFDGGWLFFQESGITLRGRWVQRDLWESGALGLSRERNVGQSRRTAGLIVGAAQTSLRAAMRHLCQIIAWKGGMQASADRIGMG